VAPKIAAIVGMLLWPINQGRWSSEGARPSRRGSGSGWTISSRVPAHLVSCSRSRSPQRSAT